MALAGDHVQVLVDGYQLTGDMNRIAIADGKLAHDVTAFSDGVHHIVLGQRQMALDHTGYLNSAAARSHPVLKGNALDGVISLLLGQNADPAVGDPVYSLHTLQSKYGVLPEVNRYVPFTALFGNKGDLGGWGVALAVPVSFTTSSAGSAVDEAAASSNGGAAFLHILQAAASDTYTFTVEGSATGAFSGEESTLATFSRDGSALGSERVSLTGSIPRYTRWKAVRSGSAGDTVEIAVSLVRF